MKQLIYLSRATIPFTFDDLLALRAVAETHNATVGVTGCMLFSRGNFIQLLEGDAADVDALYTKIATDSRHEHLNVVYDRPAEQRAFPNWWMAVHDLEREQDLGPEIHGTIAGMAAAIEDDPMAAYDLFTHFSEVINSR